MAGERIRDASRELYSVPAQGLKGRRCARSG